MITRRAFTAALSLTGLAALAGFSPLRLITDAMAQSATDVAKPVSLPDMAIGPANATVTITEANSNPNSGAGLPNTAQRKPSATLTIGLRPVHTRHFSGIKLKG